MAKRFLTRDEEGELQVTQIIGPDPDGLKLTKVLFELSRTTDMTAHFTPLIHNRNNISEGLPGHRPLDIVGECDHTELPADITFRAAWDWVD